MAKLNQKKSKQVAAKKKLSQRKRQARRSHNNASVITKAKVFNQLDSAHPPGKATGDRLERSANLNHIQKGNRLKLQMKNRNLPNMLINAEERGSNFVEKIEMPEQKFNTKQIFKNCYKEFKKVIEAADVIIEVLDARDPIGSRCEQVEQSVISAGSNKRLILLLNKIDLIPKDNLEKWLKYLRQEFPTVPFKASTQCQNDHLSQSRVAAIHMNKSLQSSSLCVGANFLMKMLGNYCRNQNILTSIRVGVVGYPNVGKSSIINSLKRSRSCDVGGTPGVTKSMQEVILDKHIRLLDSPGVVFSKVEKESNLALQNAVRVETLDDVITPAEAIVKRADKQQLIDHYNIPEFSSFQELLLLLAKRIGRFKKGGIPDPECAARKLLNDWNSGVIKYFTHPPETYEPTIHISAEIVQEMSKAFDITLAEEQMELDKLSNETDNVPEMDAAEGMEVGLTASASVVEPSVDEEKKGESVKVMIEKKKRKKIKAPPEDGWTSFNVRHLQKNGELKRGFKAMKKKRRRKEKLANSLASAFDGAVSLL